MNYNNSILIISDDVEKTNVLKSKLVLLRDVDTISEIPFSEALNNFIEESFDTIIIFSSNNSQIDELLNKIKTNQLIKSIPILLINDTYNEDVFLNAFDMGISDFTTCESTDAEILMRVIWCLQKNELNQKFQTQKALLTELNVIDKDLQIYAKEYTDKVFENEVINSKNSSYLSLMAICADVNSKNRLTPSLLSSIIKKSVRTSDLIGLKDNEVFYVLLQKTNTQGILAVNKRLRENLGSEYSISVGACEIKNSDYKNSLQGLQKALEEAIKLGNYIIIADKNISQKSSDWIDEITSNQKNFKLFKQAFIKKLENVIVPVFFQAQKNCEQKVFDSKIEQFSKEELSIFSIKKEDFEGEFKITYPGFSKINIDITLNDTEKSDTQRTTLDLSELTENKLTSMLNSFIRKFKKFADA